MLRRSPQDRATRRSPLHGTALPGYPQDFQRAAGDPLLDEAFARIRQVPTSRRHQPDAENDLAYALTSQSIPLADLTPAALLHYALASRAALGPGTTLYCGRLVWDVLHAMGHFPPDAPVTLRLALRGARHDAEGLVDQCGVANAEVWQLLVDYLRHRHAAGMDYSSLRQLARNLVRNFWVAIEQLRPGQANLWLDPALYRAWRERITTYSTGAAQRPRTDVYSILLPGPRVLPRPAVLGGGRTGTVGPLGRPCPIAPSATRGYATHRRRQIDRMADRTRVRQPSCRCSSSTSKPPTSTPATCSRWPLGLQRAGALPADAVPVSTPERVPARRLQHRLGRRRAQPARPDPRQPTRRAVHPENPLDWSFLGRAIIVPWRWVAMGA